MAVQEPFDFRIQIAYAYTLIYEKNVSYEQKENQCAKARI